MGDGLALASLTCIMPHTDHFELLTKSWRVLPFPRKMNDEDSFMIEPPSVSCEHASHRCAVRVCVVHLSAAKRICHTTGDGSFLFRLSAVLRSRVGSRKCRISAATELQLVRDVANTKVTRLLSCLRTFSKGATPTRELLREVSLLALECARLWPSALP